ncbi:MAG: hypothetical protein WCL17_02785, partial [Actinomycetota bacterium]
TSYGSPTTTGYATYGYTPTTTSYATFGYVPFSTTTSEIPTYESTSYGSPTTTSTSAFGYAPTTTSTSETQTYESTSYDSPTTTSTSAFGYTPTTTSGTSRSATYRTTVNGNPTSTSVSNCRTPVTVQMASTQADARPGSHGYFAGANSNDPAGLTYSSSTPTVCTVNSSTGAITFLRAGTCTIHATVVATSGYIYTASAVQTILVQSAVWSKTVTCYFANASTVITPSCHTLLVGLKNFAVLHHLTKVISNGYASPVGPPTFNTFLAKTRARTVGGNEIALIRMAAHYTPTLTSAGHGSSGLAKRCVVITVRSN